VKYAVIWTTSRGYMPGTNASLNAFEFYGHVADIYILTWGDFLTEEYKNQFAEVQFLPIDTSKWSKQKSSGWYFRFSDILFALNNLFDKYEVVLFWEGDSCLVNNIMDYFDICRSLKKVIVGTNEHGTHSFTAMTEDWPYVHTWSIPFANLPLFVPSSRTDVLKKMMNYQAREDCHLSRMDGLNYAIRDCKEDVFAVPGELWIQNVPYRMLLQKIRDKIYIAESSTELCSFHRKYWNNKICRNYLLANDISRSNKMLFNEMYNFFNLQCRVKWSESLEIWDGKSE